MNFKKIFRIFKKNNLDKIKVSNSYNFEKWLNKFSKLFFNDSTNYNIYFKIKIWEIQANKRKIEKSNIEDVIKNIDNNDIYYISSINEELKWKVINDWFINIKNDFVTWDDSIFYVWVIISWKDVHSIYKLAKEKLNRLLDTFLYEFNALKLIITNSSLISNTERVFIINDWYTEYINRKKSNEHNIIFLNKILNNKNYNLETKNKISNSIKYYKLFLSSENTEVKLLNLWIALESLFSNIDTNDGSFDRLKSFIPKLLSMNLMKNYFDEFQSFILHKIEMENEADSEYRNHEKIKNLISSKNIIINWSWDKEEKFNNVAIFKYFVSNDFKVIEDYLRNPYFIQKYKRLVNILEIDNNWQYKILHTFLKRYEKNIKWLLTKIYRYRNYIVHWWKKLIQKMLLMN